MPEKNLLWFECSGSSNASIVFLVKRWHHFAIFWNFLVLWLVFSYIWWYGVCHHLDRQQQMYSCSTWKILFQPTLLSPSNLLYETRCGRGGGNFKPKFWILDEAYLKVKTSEKVSFFHAMYVVSSEYFLRSLLISRVAIKHLIWCFEIVEWYDVWHVIGGD